MNRIDLELEPALRQQCYMAVRLSMEMEVDGFAGPWELGPLCTRDHAVNLAELKTAVEAFMKTCEEPHGEFVCAVMKKNYRSAKQAVHSILNRKP